jgi:endonuclease YncB( thermonuclease family)
MSSPPPIDWTKHNFSTTKTFSLKGLECFARVVHIHDGDTLTAIIPLINDFYKFSIRLAGIDTCEMKSSNEENKTLATKARQRLIQLVVKTKKEKEEEKQDIKSYLLQHIELVHLSCQEFDKYGRVLAHVKKTKDDTETFSDILVKEKLAYRYDGKKKLTDEEQLKYLY